MHALFRYDVCSVLTKVSRREPGQRAATSCGARVRRGGVVGGADHERGRGAGDPDVAELLRRGWLGEAGVAAERRAARVPAEERVGGRELIVQRDELGVRRRRIEPVVAQDHADDLADVVVGAVGATAVVAVGE